MADPANSTYVAQCFGKEAYDTPQLAHAALARRKAFRSKNRSTLNTYRCPYCGKFHHGSAKRKGKFQI